MKIKDLPFHLKHHSEQQATAKTDQISQTHLLSGSDFKAFSDLGLAEKKLSRGG